MEVVPSCRACCGVLEESRMDPILDRVVQEISESDYESDHFMMAVSLPVSLTLRNHSLQVLLEEAVDGFDEDEVPNIKQVWKWVFSPKLAKRLGMKLAGGDNCQFYAELQLESASDKKEMECLQKMCKDEYAQRAKNVKRYNMGA